MMIPLQSGSNRILGLMGRGYSRESFIDTLRSLRKECPELVLITQIIVGFPGETEDEFRESIQVATEAECTNVTLFPFYPNPLTPAGRLPGQVSDRQKIDRIEWGLGKLGRRAIFSFGLGIELDPRFQVQKALYD